MLKGMEVYSFILDQYMNTKDNLKNHIFKDKDNLFIEMEIFIKVNLNLAKDKDTEYKSITMEALTKGNGKMTNSIKGSGNLKELKNKSIGGMVSSVKKKLTTFQRKK